MKRFLFFILAIGTLISCSKDNYTVEYAEGYPDKLAGNWIVYQFHGGDLDGSVTGPYDLVTALDPNQEGYLIFDNIYDTDVRCRAEILGDTGFYAYKTEQLEVLNYGGYGIETISLEGYSNTNSVLVNFLYSLAASSYENISFEESDISEIILVRLGLYDAYASPVDTLLILGYRKTGFENVAYD
jgi:hypothetical protein